MNVPPQKIQLIKEIRQMTGLGLAEAKGIIDYLFREHGPMNTYTDEVQQRSSERYTFLPGSSTAPDFSGSMRINRAGAAGTGDDSDVNGDHEARIKRIEDFIRYGGAGK